MQKEKHENRVMSQHKHAQLLTKDEEKKKEKQQYKQLMKFSLTQDQISNFSKLLELIPLETQLAGEYLPSKSQNIAESIDDNIIIGNCNDSNQNEAKTEEDNTKDSNKTTEENLNSWLDSLL